MTVAELHRIDQMDGHDFEFYCAEVLRRNGFHDVTVTKGSGDFGIDILAKKDDRSYAIQCKRYNQKVGNKAVQEALSGSVYYSYDTPVVLTNSYFTEQAQEQARRTNVILWDRSMLEKLSDNAFPSDRFSAFLSRKRVTRADRVIPLHSTPTYSFPKYTKKSRKKANPGLKVIFSVFLLLVIIGSSRSNHTSSYQDDASTDSSITPYSESSVESDSVKKSGWIEIKGDWYYYSEDGTMETGWIKPQDRWYYLDMKGRMVTGLQTINGTLYYFDDTSGEMKTGWIQLGTNWYYFDDNGKGLKTEWLKYNNNWYWFDEKGIMVTGDQTIDGTSYTFFDNGVMQ